ncbi:MAG: YkgJ family cysteine cluster protein [Thermodesulfobacteriota bacterium]|nr:YkgJ family cysteine cluster protein [Thermodesulfobacteriota bacterium]
MIQQNICKQCGTCCEKGGPALHSQDLDLIKQGLFSFDQFITIRKGELAHDPVKNSIEPVKDELVKIRGIKGAWTCCFYNKNQHGCTIYDHRPLACKVLKCWDTDGILELSGKDLLSRLDIVEKSSPLREKIVEHEQLFPCPDMKAISRKASRLSKKKVKNFEGIINGDLTYRTNTVGEFGLSVSEELFYFGRPIFQLFQSLGFTIRETSAGIRLKRRD